MTRHVAALFVERGGPYFGLLGPEWCWDRKRNAFKFDLDCPVVAHPECGPWSKLRHLCTKQDPLCAPFALTVVRRNGGVLEHPAHSQLWTDRGLVRPGEGVDLWGGYTVAVNQVAWGHSCAKPTWLYIVGVPRMLVADGIRTGGEPTHCVCTGPRQTKRLPVASKPMKRRTPPAFAEWLVSLARASRVAGQEGAC